MLIPNVLKVYAQVIADKKINIAFFVAKKFTGYADNDQIFRAVENIIVNALDFLPYARKINSI